MTKDEFIKGYCLRSKVEAAWLWWAAGIGAA